MQIAYSEAVGWLAGNERFTFSTMKHTRTRFDARNLP